jgi:hypothetical protein
MINQHRQRDESPRSTGSLRFDPEQIESATDDRSLRRPPPERSAQSEPSENRQSSFKRPGEGPFLEEILRWFARSLAVLAVLSSFALLCVGATPFLNSVRDYVGTAVLRGWTLIKHLPLSAIPLLLAGTSYLVLQAILRPSPLELLKRLMLGVAFLLWGTVQLMRPGDLASELGNIVIALYVVDLGLIIWTDLQKNQPRLAG